MLLSGIWGDGTTAAQLPVDVKKTNEIPVFRQLLEKIPAADLEDAVITADQMHTQRKHARKIRAAGAHLIFTIGENQKKLFRAADALPWGSIAGEAWTVDRGHGRVDARTIKTLPPTPLIESLLPHAAHVVLAERSTSGPDRRPLGAVAAPARDPSSPRMPGRPGKHRITSSNAIRYRTEKYAAHANHRTCSRPVVVLDIAIVNVALPSIQKDLGIGQSTLQWIVIAYGLMLGGFLLFGGRMADLLGRRRVLLAGLTLFSAASLLAGVAGSAGFLIGARTLHGFGAGLVPPAALSSLAVTFKEGAERNRALGRYGATARGPASASEIASGLLTEGPGWRWVFFINVPAGVLLIAMAAIFLPADGADRRGSNRFDVAGAVTVTAGLLLLVYALNRSTDYGWSSGPALGLLAASAVMLSAFVRIEARSRSPLVPRA